MSEPQFIKKAEAATHGLRFYFPLKSCKYGHSARRYVASGGCVECASLRAAERNARPENRESHRLYEVMRRARVPEKYRDAGRLCYARHAEQRREYQRQDRQANKPKYQAYARLARVRYKDKIRAGWKEWYAKNKPSVLQRGREYREQNRERYLSYTRAYAKANPLAKRMAESKRRAWKKSGSSISRIAPAEIRKLLSLQRKRCANCYVSLVKAGYEVDHVMPLALGGPHMISNLQILCPICNRRKNAKHPLVFAKESGKLL